MNDEVCLQAAVRRSELTGKRETDRQKREGDLRFKTTMAADSELDIVVAILDEDQGLAYNNTLPWPYLKGDHEFYINLTTTRKDPKTAARLAPRAAEDDSEALQRSSSLRRRAAAFMAVGEGEVTSRKDLYGDSEDDESIDSESDVEEENEDGEEERSDDGGEDVEDEQEEVEMLDDDDEDDDDEEVDSEGQESDDGDQSEEEDDEAGDSDEEITSAESESAEEETIMQDTAVDEGEKAEAVVQQLDLWDRLMEARIQLQKVLTQVNRLPAPSQTQPPSSPSEAKDVLLEVNCTLCDARSSPSSSRKRKAEADLEEMAQQNHESLLQSRNATLTFWDEKTRLASKKFKSFKSYQTPIVKQVEQILADRDRLLRRSQVIRDSDAPDVCDKPEEIFDDNDFYQRLLKNLIESKASEDSSMSTSASQWLEVQRLRGKKKKKKDVDTRASKGRKLRYNIHTKMVNFMAPRDDSTWSTEARNDLFKNLFKMPSYSEQ